MDKAMIASRDALRITLCLLWLGVVERGRALHAALAAEDELVASAGEVDGELAADRVAARAEGSRPSGLPMPRLASR